MKAAPREGAFFLDRDGVINAPPGKKRYVTRWAEFRFLPGTLKALRRLGSNGRKVVVISNQAGVGRRLMTRAQLDLITRRMRAAVRRAGGRVDAVYYCTHRPEEKCRCRKPKTGMIRRACKQLKIDPKRSTLVGDNATDIRMGKAAGCRTVLILSGVSSRADARRMPDAPDRIARDLWSAIPWIIAQHPPAKGRRIAGTGSVSRTGDA